MTDNEIVKALECCGVDPKSGKFADCKNCPLDALDDADCFNFVIQQHALDLINRQKAEIERLSEDVDGYKAELESEHLSRMDNIHDLITEIKKSKVEGIKEFAERLLSLKIKPEFPWDDFYVTEDTIDSVKKEMIDKIGGNSNEK